MYSRSGITEASFGFNEKKKTKPKPRLCKGKNMASHQVRAVVVKRDKGPGRLKAWGFSLNSMVHSELKGANVTLTICFQCFQT